MEYGAVVVWWVTLVVLAAAGLPVAAFVLGALPDRGAPLALPVGLVVLFVPVYWLGHLRFGPTVVVLGAVALAGASVAASRRAGPVDLGRFAEWLVVFTIGFLLVIAIRAVDPSVVPGGGEKFLDYGLLQSLLRSTSLPPEDAWFAGRPVQYYYGGHLLAATLATLTGTAARFAYNLALAGFYGALVGAAYGVGGAIAASRGGSYRLAGGLSAFLVGIASNVAPLLQAVLWLLPDGLAGSIAAAVTRRSQLPEDALVSSSAFSYWDASRVIPGVINEFPFFAFLNGDLHAHMMSTPFMLLVVGLGLAYFLTPAAALRRRRLLVYGAVPPVGGALAVINTWSFPTVAGVIGLSVLFADAPARDLLPGRLASPAWLERRLPRPDGNGDVADEPVGVGGEGGHVGDERVGVGDELARMGSAAFAAAAVAALGVLWAFTFFVGPATGAEGRSLGFLPERSGLLSFVLVHGWFLLVYGLSLLSGLGRTVGRRRRRLVLSAGLVFVAASAFVEAASAAVVLVVLAVAWYLLRREGDVGYEAVLFVAGAGLVVLVEFVYVIEQAGSGRYNTVFKTYMQVWVLWATGAGAVTAALAARASRASRDSRASRAPSSWSVPAAPRPGRLAAGALVLLLVASSSIYAVASLGAHFDDAPEPTLDATVNAQTYHPAEWQAIQFIDARPGRPTIVDAPGCYCNPGDDVGPYRWANAPSTFTGVPTVAGWSHEIGYRGEGPYLARVDDVETIYTGPREERTALLREYGVEYVYVGPNERTLYGDVDLADEPGFEVAFENEQVTIYAVTTDALDGSTS